MNVNGIYETLSRIPGIIPDRLINIGEQRTDPKGAKLEGVYVKSRCGFGFTKEWQSSSSVGLPDALDAIITKLGPYKHLLREITDSGGKLDFFIGLGIDANAGLTLNVELLGKLSDLCIEVGSDIYPPDKEIAANGHS